MNKKELIEEVKVLFKAKGKEHLMDFAEEMAELAWAIVKIIVAKTENKIDDIVVASLDSMVEAFIDKIDGENESES